MTRSDILNAVRDGECSKAFGEKCMALAAEAATHWDHFCASENERVAAEKERDDARREVEDLRRQLVEERGRHEESLQALLDEALALPSDRTALDQALAAERAKALEEAAARCERDMAVHLFSDIDKTMTQRELMMHLAREIRALKTKKEPA